MTPDKQTEQRSGRTRSSVVQGGCTGGPFLVPSKSLRAPMPPVSALVATFVGWFAATAAYAYIYVSQAIAWPLAQGYEHDWEWQLFFFAITRLPWLLGLLVAVLAIESIVLARS